MNVLLNVYICALRKNTVPLLCEWTRKIPHVAPQRMPTKINNNGAIVKVRIL